MKNTKFFKTHAEDALAPEYSFEILQDPVRSKILFEIILNGKINADHIVEATGKSRSTISHHLKKLVENGILDVSISPTGKTKYYQITKNLERLMYSFDKEKFAEGSVEEQSAFIIELCNMFSLVSNIFANLQIDQINLLKENQPFNKIKLDEDGRILFNVKNKPIKEPYLTFFVTGEEHAEFIRDGLKKLMKDFDKKFGEMPTPEATFEAESKHLVNLQIMPIINKKDLK